MSKSKSIVESEYALKDNKLVFVDDVPNGIKCGCICPHCKAKMEAKNGGNLKKHHFSHYKAENCGLARESAYHLMTKEVIEKTKNILFPGETLPRTFENVEVEKRVDYSDLQPDCVVIDSEGNRIWIEVKYTHGITKEKEDRIIKDNIDCLEIDVTKYPLDPNEIEHLLKTDLSSKRWINSLEFRKQKEEIENYRKKHPEHNFYIVSRCEDCLNKLTERNSQKHKIIKEIIDLIPKRNKEDFRKKLLFSIWYGMPLLNCFYDAYHEQYFIEDNTTGENKRIYLYSLNSTAEIETRNKIIEAFKRFNNEFKLTTSPGSSKCKFKVKTFTYRDKKYVVCKGVFDYFELYKKYTNNYSD